MGFKYKEFGTFTGPLDKSGDYSYDKVSKEDFWWKDLPEDLSFKLSDIGIVFYKEKSDYAYFHLYGTSTSLVTLEKNSGDLPNLIANIQNTVFNGKIIVNDKIVCNDIITANGSILCNGAVDLKSSATLSGIGDMATYMTTTRDIANSKKSFDIPHPSKENHRLRYVCVEGPSADVYVRGKLKDSTTIELPEYWRHLVDPESIDVVLTPIGSYQELFVEKIEWGSRVIVKNNAGGPINCSYVVYGERADVSPNISEYVGSSQDDYPGDNEEYVINGSKSK